MPLTASADQCQYLNDYNHDNVYGDERVQSYLNTYAKMGLGGPVQIQIPDCVTKESEASIRNRQIKPKKDGTAVPESNDQNTDTANVAFETPNFSKTGEYVVTQRGISGDRKNKEITEQKLSYLKGNSTFCKAVAICEKSDGTQYLNSLFCRGSKPNECPTANDCMKDNAVQVANKCELQVKGGGVLRDGSPNLEGAQSPSTVKGR